MEVSELNIKDEAYTQEEFSLKPDKNGVLQTSPKPSGLSKYYEFGGYISHRSEPKTLIHNIYNLVKNQMFKTKFKCLTSYSNAIETVLDFGCGTGEFVTYLKKKGVAAEGIEPTSLAYQKARQKNIQVYKSLSETKSNYDAITLFHVLEHVDDYETTIEELVLKLNTKGLLLIAVPNYKSYDANYYKEKWAAWDVPRHLWHFNRTNIKELAQRHNLELIKITPMPFDAFYISMVSESYKSNSKLKGILTGLISNLKAMSTKEYSSNLFLLQKKA
ncbi:class I SAM-dependent methyltransferase [Psychroflexus aurantiacus]|nr:class I SAM-dependent methyltransferase [Psychroflexus aurantiacus]